MPEHAALQAGDVYRRVRALRLHVVRHVRTLLAGTYLSAFRGLGVEFLEFAPYQPGDDVRRIDWMVSARRLHPCVRRYAEERELKVLLAMDVSASMDVGAPGRTARELGCTLAAAVGLSAVQNGDRTGALLFGGEAIEMVPFRRGERHVLGILSRMLSGTPGGTHTDLRPALTRVRALRGHAVVLLLSDFLCRPAPWDSDVRTLLSACARKHDVRVVRLDGPHPPGAVGRAFLEGADAESGGPALCELQATGGHEHTCRTADAFARCRVRHAGMGASDDWLRGLSALLGGARGNAG